MIIFKKKEGSVKGNRKMSEWEKTVRKRLIDHGMNCSDLAKELGVSRVYLHDILVGARTPLKYRCAINTILDINDDKGEGVESETY